MVRCFKMISQYCDAYYINGLVVKKRCLNEEDSIKKAKTIGCQFGSTIYIFNNRNDRFEFIEKVRDFYQSVGIKVSIIYDDLHEFENVKEKLFERWKNIKIVGLKED